MTGFNGFTYKSWTRSPSIFFFFDNEWVIVLFQLHLLWPIHPKLLWKVIYFSPFFRFSFFLSFCFIVKIFHKNYIVNSQFFFTLSRLFLLFFCNDPHNSQPQFEMITTRVYTQIHSSNSYLCITNGICVFSSKAPLSNEQGHGIYWCVQNRRTMQSERKHSFFCFKDIRRVWWSFLNFIKCW